MLKNAKIYIAGHKGLVGSAILKSLKDKGYQNIVTRTHKQLDLTNTKAVSDFFSNEQPDYVFLAAAKVGGIVANNKYRAEFIYQNLMIQNNVIHQSYLNNVKKLLFLGSTCIYPKNAPQPMVENCLLTDELEYTNEPYAIAKIAGIKMCESYNIQYNTNFLSVMPTNLFGPNDNFNLETSHVLPALIRKIHLGKALENNDWRVIKEDFSNLPIEGIEGNADKNKLIAILHKYGVKLKADTDKNSKKNQVQIEIWGSGEQMREFLWSEDMADACTFIMEKVNFKDVSKNKKEIRNTHINIGTGEDISIKELANTIKKIIEFEGDLYFNKLKPDGTLKKLTNPSKLHKLGWKHTVELEQGISKLYKWYCNK